jgi:DNA topoisomerase-3
MLVRREAERDAFVSKNFWDLEASFDIQTGGEYSGKWFDPDFKKNDDDTRKADRIFDQARAESIRTLCTGKPASVTETQKPSSQSCPPLYDLTSLQREANQRFGFSAKATLGMAQALYERHKAVTYPRTDSRHLPEDYLPVCKDLMKGLQKGDLGSHAKLAVEKSYVRQDKKIFDTTKISDHFAIIPTQEIPSGLSEPEQKIYRMIVQRFIGVFYPPARFLNTSRVSVVASSRAAACSTSCARTRRASSAGSARRTGRSSRST